MPKSEPEFLAAPAVLERYGISDMSLWRWIRDPSLAFPRPVYIGRYRYFVRSELEAWERALPRERIEAEPQPKRPPIVPPGGPLSPNGSYWTDGERGR